MNTLDKVKKPRNPIAKDLRTPKYRMLVCRNKTLYQRKPKHPAAAE
jgi:hypothetical protein